MKTGGKRHGFRTHSFHSHACWLSYTWERRASVDQGAVPHQRRPLQGASQGWLGRIRKATRARPPPGHLVNHGSWGHVTPHPAPTRGPLRRWRLHSTRGGEKRQGGRQLNRPPLCSVPRSLTPDSTPHRPHGAKVIQGCKGGWEMWLSGAGSGGKEEEASGPCPFVLWFPKTPSVHTQHSGSPREMPGGQASQGSVPTSHPVLLSPPQHVRPVPVGDSFSSPLTLASRGT